MLLRLVNFLFISVVIGCASHSQTSVTKRSESDVYKLIGSHYDSLPNTTGKFILFVQKLELTTRNPSLKAAVLETSSKKILTSFSFTPGYSKWISEYEVEIFNAPGIIKKEENVSKFIRIIKVKPSTTLP
jgi:hypothetical protein